MEVKIIDYDPRYRHHFKDLNVEWIAQYFTVEPHDLEQLEDPENYILSRGGRIFFALYGEEIIGTVALIKVSETVFEMVKMAVRPGFRGLGAGEKLGRHLIEAARQAGGQRLFLESNQKLTPALTLYRKLGFVEIPIGETLYSRADFKAEIYL
jgi:ribosomal protein S18 acetylase RimI-like enzyme